MLNLRGQLTWQKWLARLSWTFLILAVLLGWSAYGSLRGYREPMPQWRIILDVALAAACFVLWAAGIRTKYRMIEENQQRRDRQPPEADDQDEDQTH
jgi:hypothetical protein